MRKLILLIAALIFNSQELTAGSFDPKPDEICTPSPVTQRSQSRVDPRKIIGYLFKSQSIHDFDLDTSGGDLTFDRKIDAIVAYYSHCKNNKQCSKDAPTKLNNANTALLGFLISYSRPLPSDRDGFEVQPPVNQNTDDSALIAFLQGKSNSFKIRCVHRNQINEPASPEGEATGVQTNVLVASIMIRKKVEDLKFTRADPKFKSAERATVSFEDNQVKQTRTWTTEGVLGIPIGKDPFGPYSNFVAFSTYKGQFANNSTAKNPNIGNVGVGFSADSTFPVFGYYQNLQTYIHLLHSHVTDSDLLMGNLIYTPDFYFPGVGLAYNPLGGPASFLLKPQAKLIYGNVLNIGTNPNLPSTNNFMRAGPRLELWIFGESGLLKAFSFTSSYEYLRVYRGPFDAIWRFENTLNYTFPDQEYWSLNLTYANGRDLNTLDREQRLTLGLGLKY